MTRKIIFDEALKQNIINYAKTTYQCTINDIANEFNFSRHSIITNFSQGELDPYLFKGCKDTTKEKLKLANLGRVTPDETRKKISSGVKEASKLRTEESWEASAKKAKQTKINNWGSWENYIDYQQQTSKRTKLERYDDENYNNQEKIKQTKLERHGDENYNNKEQIRDTQFALYGGYAFNDKEKYEATMLKNHNCRHNWSSDDPKLNGRETMYKNAGSKEQHYKNVLMKGRQTRLELYGDEFYSNTEQAQKTMLEKFGVPYYMMTSEFRSITSSSDVRAKAIETRRENGTFNTSNPEVIVKQLLEEHFGSSDVLTEFNKDPRYPYHCDFYIKSLDLFIELNLFPTHGLHPFDSANADDLRILSLLEANKTEWNSNCIDVWTVRDVAKFNSAKENNLNYITLYPNDDYMDIINIINTRMAV